MGRFNSPDPSSGSDSASPWSWNKYLYVGGDPVNFKDRHGLNRSEEDEDEGYPDQPFIPSPGGGYDPGATGGASSAGFVGSLVGFDTAFNMAKAALAKADCRGLFAADGMDPASLLGVLRGAWTSSGLASGPGYMTTDKLTDASAESRYVGTMAFSSNLSYYKNANGDRVETDKVAIVIDAQTWNGQTDTWRAQTLIHELGHVFNMLAGAGGSMFVYDADVKTGKADPGAEEFNASLEKKCIN